MTRRRVAVAVLLGITAWAQDAPYPPSKIIANLTWDADAYRIGAGQGGRDGVGDNWPITWGADGHMYTSYGDGMGFAKQPGRYLTLGFARILGDPPNARAEDIPSDADTPVGWGKKGIKSSGQVMVNGAIYMFVRNYVVNGDYRNSRLGWSKNLQKNWTWADWHFSEGFGCPEFVQFGPNYSGARDRFVYVVSQDGSDAYEFNPDVVLARVPKDRIAERSSYEFFAGLHANGKPTWTRDTRQRKPIFHDERGTQRIAMTYNAALRRYILVSSHRVGTGVHNPSLGVFDAPEPWGPWTTAYYDDKWSGDLPTYHHKFPTKWMSKDGRSMWLLYSGGGGNNYTFVVRRATLTVSR